MSYLRFKVGDLAVVAIAEKAENIGRIVEIAAVGPFKTGDHVRLPCGGSCNFRPGYKDRADYVLNARWKLENEHGLVWLVAHDWQLRKLDPPAEPESLRRCEEVEQPEHLRVGV